MAKQSRSPAQESSESDYVSVWFWMFAQFLLMLPLINLVAVPVLAFVGENRSRKNFFRALLLWLVLFVVLHIVTFFVVFTSPTVFQWFKDVWVMLIELVSLKK